MFKSIRRSMQITQNAKGEERNALVYNWLVGVAYGVWMTLEAQKVLQLRRETKELEQQRQGHEATLAANRRMQVVPDDALKPRMTRQAAEKEYQEMIRNGRGFQIQ